MSINNLKVHEQSAPYPGFEKHELRVFFKDRLSFVCLMLPMGPAIEELVSRRAQAATAAALAHDAQEEERLEAARKRIAEPRPPASPPPRRSSSLSALEERDGLFQRYLDEQPKRTPPAWVQVYAWDEPLKLLGHADSTPDRDQRERDQNIFKSLRQQGAFRRVGGYQDELNILGQELQRLRRDQPHFAEVVDSLMGQVRLAEAKGSPLRFPPMLLVGPPGVGKTHFTLELARAIERPIRRHSMDVSHTGASLTGSARNWGNTHTGLVFDLICRGDRADPLVLLDELDKARPSSRDDNPLAPLHGLLEPLTASKVTDISAGIEFDASHIFWVATANSLDSIPEPIRSRFRVFNISMPTAEEAIALAQGVGDAVHQRMNEVPDQVERPEGTIFDPPAPRLYCLLAHLTPREQIQALEQAYATALANGRRQVLRHDLPVQVLMESGDVPDLASRLMC